MIPRLSAELQISCLFSFILIAMLVCITTMTRMVDEERTQIGVLKAMGYGNGVITGKYLLYSGVATAIGWIIGFFGGTVGIPKIFGLHTAHFMILHRLNIFSILRLHSVHLLLHLPEFWAVRLFPASENYTAILLF